MKNQNKKSKNTKKTQNSSAKSLSKKDLEKISGGRGGSRGGEVISSGGY
jgi:bacteriocin-like protein